MIQKFNKKSWAYGLPGLLIQTAGAFVMNNTLVILAGTILFVIGLSYYAKGKGYSGWLGLFGLLSWLGIIILAVLKDKNKNSAEQNFVENKQVTEKAVSKTLLIIIFGIPLILAIILIIL